MRTPSMPSLALAGLLVAPVLAHAQGICDSFGPGNSSDPVEFLPVRGPSAGGPEAGRAAAYFVEDWCAEGQLRWIELALTHTGGSGSVTVALHAGDAASIDAAFWMRTVSIGSSVQYFRHTEPGSIYTMLPQRYWVVLTPADANTAANWHLNDQNLTGTAATRHWDAAQSEWGPWIIAANIPIPALRIASDWCYADCDRPIQGGHPPLTIDDFTCFINEFAMGQSLPHGQQITHYANCDASTIAPVLNVDDFTCFINAFATGCP